MLLLVTLRTALGCAKMGLHSGGTVKVRWTLWSLIFLTFVMMFESCVANSCNWSGSGLDLQSDSEVRPIYLHCSQGQVRWTYPSGGLRIQFQPRTKVNPEKNTLSGPTEFRICIRVDREFSGARIYLEGHRRLLLLHSGQEDDDQRPLTSKRCFLSVRGQAALYVEGQKSARVKGSWRKEATFSYDLQTISQEEYLDDQLECRPCTKEELIQQFCSSEFVIKGEVTSLCHDPAMDNTLMDVKVSNVVRDSSNSAYTLNRVEKGRTVLSRPLKCGTKFGAGQFLFMGRTLLGESQIKCAPRWKDWKIVRNEAFLEGSNPCLLQD